MARGRWVFICSNRQTAGEQNEVKIMTKIFEPSIIIHTVPFAKTIIDDKDNTVIVEFDDSPYQAIRIVTADCADYDFIPDDIPIGEYKRYICEVCDSKWIRELKNELKECDPDATFLDNARHFIFNMGESVLEVVATEVEFIDI